MYTQEITVNNEVGLHARPATFFIQKANEFKSGIWVEKEDRRVNAKSLLGVLSLGIVKAMKKAAPTGVAFSVVQVSVIYYCETGAGRRGIWLRLKANRLHVWPA